ncbi:MAG: DUF22 domain-containing protein [Methanobacteriota archaeon]
MAEIINLVYRKDLKLQTKKVKATPYEFTIATRAKWELVIADEDVAIEPGKLWQIKIKDIKLQKDVLVMPCAFSHHGLASIIKVGTKEGPAPVETDRVINMAYIMGHDSGEIKKGDFLSILNLFPIMFTREATKPVQVGQG